MERDELIRLANKILSRDASDEEISRYIRWFNANQQNKEQPIKDAELKKAVLYARVQNQLQEPKNNIRLLLFRLSAAAIILIIFSIAGYQLLKNPVPDSQQLLAMHDIKPGRNKAVLTLSNGEQIILDDAKNGALTSDQGVLIKKKRNGQLVYDLSHTTVNNQAYQLNTISTPRGGQYEVVLPDGTKVWLNAASSLKFPAAFAGADREVQLTGEAYFEVAKDKTHPFHVTSASQTIEVLGTHFNINIYDDEPEIKTTLLEGSVKVSKGDVTALLKPGQQAVVSEHYGIQINNDVNTEEVMAWKNAKFYFNQTDIQTLMRQISRWYDVTVVYEGKIPEDKFNGTLSRNVNLSNVLKLLDFAGIKFKIEGRKILIK